MTRPYLSIRPEAFAKAVERTAESLRNPTAQLSRLEQLRARSDQIDKADRSADGEEIEQLAAALTRHYAKGESLESLVLRLTPEPQRRPTLPKAADGATISPITLHALARRA